MPFATLKFSKSDVNRAGDILAERVESNILEYSWAEDVLANWRAIHGYPMNTFQPTLREKLRHIDGKAIVAQRLKRTPSIISKLQRFPTMNLSQIQDIGGLRAIVNSVQKARALEKAYRNAKFAHTLVNTKDYIESPKSDGYRSIHLIYRYKNAINDKYDGLHVELEIRTRLQHAWATALETASIFLKQALKSGQGEEPWRHFFAVASAGIAHLEGSNPVPGFNNKKKLEVFELVAQQAHDLKVIQKLTEFVVAADIITDKARGAYNLVVLEYDKRSVSIKSFAKTDLERANEEYGKVEQRTKAGESVEAVLVSAGPIDALKKAYPNYFLDTHKFVEQIQLMISEAKKQK